MIDVAADDGAARFRAGMVDSLRKASAASNPRVLEAMGRIAREVFVPHFWFQASPAQSGAPAATSEWMVDPAADDYESALSLVYDTDRALAIRTDAETVTAGVVTRITSAASAPLVVASMLDLSDLQLGMRVLEIGTGSGYNAALLSELVGPRGQVTSIEIDDSLIGEAIVRLDQSGYSEVIVKAGDGYFGVPERAPFDRVIATVGCSDIAPAWLEQLAPDGFCLIPLQHGSWHPLMKANRVGGGARGTVVRGAGFVAIQGYQAGRGIWPNAGLPPPSGPLEWSPLPPWLTPHLKLEPNSPAAGARRALDLVYLVAMEDRRSCFSLSLVDGSSAAVIDPSGARIGRVGTASEQLALRLLDIANQWVGLGCPAITGYESSFTTLQSPPSEDHTWVIERVDFRQTIQLAQ